MNRVSDVQPEPTYCHCAVVFRCKPATAEAEDQNGVWVPLCGRCAEIAWEAGLRIRKLQPVAA